MKTKLVSLCVMLCLVVLAIVVTPTTALACSGDNCGCYTDSCADDICAGLTGQTYTNCMSECNHAQARCAICCCCDWPGCPIYC